MKSLVVLLITTVLVSSVTGCNKTSENSSNGSNNSSSITETSSSIMSSNSSSLDSSSSVSSRSKSTAKTVKAGTFCFKYDDETLTAWTKIKINKNNQITGNLEGEVHDNKSQYYTSYVQDLRGTVEKNQLKLNIKTQIENDQQESEGNWTITPSGLIIDGKTYSSIDCTQLAKTIPNNNPSITPTPSNSPEANSSPSNTDTTDGNQRPPVRIRFDKGANSKTIENSVIRGDRDVYIFGAGANQDVKITITSLEDNAVFDTYLPNGEIVEAELKELEITTPQAGDYKIIVGGTRGNATYKLTLEIK